MQYAYSFLSLSLSFYLACQCEFTIIQHRFSRSRVLCLIYIDMRRYIYIYICSFYADTHNTTPHKTCKLLYFLKCAAKDIWPWCCFMLNIYKGFLCEVKRTNNGDTMLIWILFSFGGLKWFCYKIDFTTIGITSV